MNMSGLFSFSWTRSMISCSSVLSNHGKNVRMLTVGWTLLLTLSCTQRPCSRLWFDLCDDSCSLLSSLSWRGEEWSSLLMTPSATRQSLIITTICRAEWLLLGQCFDKSPVTERLWDLAGKNTTGMIYAPPLTRHGKRTIQVTNALVSTSECI